jgi:predicted nucleic acid-binding protein
LTFVVDASVTLGWCFPDESNPYPQKVLQRLRDNPAIVSSVWPLEIANGLLVAERRGRVTAADLVQAHEILMDLPISADDTSLDAALGPVSTLARRYNLTAYDASYLELAMREGLPLATLDESLRAAAGQAGVELAE